MQTTFTQSATTLCTWWNDCVTTSFSLSEWAAWIQAVGSVAAIVVATVIARQQFAAATRLEEFRQRVQNRQRIEVVRTLFAQVLSLCQLMVKGFAAVPEPGAARQKLIDDIDTEHFTECIRMLESLPLLDIPSGDLAVYVINAPKTIYNYTKTIKEGKRQAMLFPMGNLPAEFLGEDFEQVVTILNSALNVCLRELGLPAPTK